MDLSFDQSLATAYTSESQRVRVMSEAWAAREILCPKCRISLSPQAANSKAKDFECSQCAGTFEQKSKQGQFSSKVVDGAYDTMMARLGSLNSPHFFFLNYDPKQYCVTQFFVVPSFLFPLAAVEKRQSLSPTAKRAGWVGCNFLLQKIPESSRFFYIKNAQVNNIDEINAAWQKAENLFSNQNLTSRTWLHDILFFISKINKNNNNNNNNKNNKYNFLLSDLYLFENELQKLHPSNNNIKAKIRQQLQVLRDKNYLSFSGVGKYTIL
jgi:type II restriction enzyme